MIRQARIKLTLLYSAIFLVLFWSLSFGIYIWMDQFLGDPGRLHHLQFFKEEASPPLLRNEPPSDIIIDNLRNVLVTIDFILLVSIPTITWFLTGTALAPVQKAHKREQQFLSDASHELRTPLTILRAEIEVALKKKRSTQDYQKVLQSNKEDIDDLIGLVENLLFISRAQAKQNVPILEKVDITDILTERMASFHKEAKQKKLEFVFKPPETSFVINGNPHLLKRLFSNLLDNAIKYTSQGSIIVAVKRTKTEATITITDTGIGIPKEHQEKIFDRFYRADESRSEHGYGLGLSIAKQIMQVHQGTIAVKSDEKKGTSMIVSFPLLKQDRENNLS